MKKLVKDISIVVFTIILIISITIILSKNFIYTNNKIVNCDTSCLNDYITCLSNSDTCKTDCWKDYNKYMKDNLIMCRDFEGTEKCRDIADKTTKRDMALESQQCQVKCDNSLNKCEKDNKVCAENIRKCMTKGE
ncbi:hypothetical protein HY498_05030 [Candidatus Woesearchaeota archaeon]|nr:hypothetical protein [Candidatus Woesearchaeota archaeon]